MTSPILIDNVLTNKEVEFIRTTLTAIKWERGASTAGPVAASVKHNWQAEGHDSMTLRGQVQHTIMRNEMFRALVRPQIIGLVFSRYDEGCEYGTHIDAAEMSGVRRDVSFTISLSAHHEYEGGWLEIDRGLTEDKYRIGLGSMLVYPATSLHRVTPITRGSRFVIVGWARSLVRDPYKRELLFDLDLAKSKLFADHGKTAEIDLISKCSANLMRMWMED